VAPCHHDDKKAANEMYMRQGCKGVVYRENNIKTSEGIRSHRYFCPW